MCVCVCVSTHCCRLLPTANNDDDDDQDEAVQCSGTLWCGFTVARSFTLLKDAFVSAWQCLGIFGCHLTDRENLTLKVG